MVRGVWLCRISIVAVGLAQTLPACVDDASTASEIAALRRELKELATRDQKQIGELQRQVRALASKHTTMASANSIAPESPPPVPRLRAPAPAPPPAIAVLEAPVGRSFTTADILLTTCLTWAVDYRVPVTAACLAYVERITSRQAYRDSLEANTAKTDA